METLFIACIVSFIAMVTDMKSRTIPNKLILLGGILLLITIFIQKEAVSDHLFIFLCSTPVFFALWYFRILGGGDAKLLMVLSLAFSNAQNLLQWLIFISIIGGPIGAWYIYKKQSTLPYGVAIFFGTFTYIIAFIIRT